MDPKALQKQSGRYSITDNIPKSVWDDNQLNYLAVDYVQNTGKANDQYMLDILFAPNGWRSSDRRSLNCKTVVSDYTVKVNFTDARQTIKVETNERALLGVSITEENDIFLKAFSNLKGKEYTEVLPDNLSNDNGPSLGQTYRMCNIRAIRDSLTTALQGAISGYGKLDNPIQR